jgi:hypothetical protein
MNHYTRANLFSTQFPGKVQLDGKLNIMFKKSLAAATEFVNVLGEFSFDAVLKTHYSKSMQYE